MNIIFRREWLLFNVNFSAISFSMRDDEVHFVLDQHPLLYIFIVLVHWNNLPLAHIILIPSQPVYALSPYC